MKLTITAALLLAAFTLGIRADDAPAGTQLVPNNHGGYNVANQGVQTGGTPLFGSHPSEPQQAPVGTVLVPNNHGGYNVANPSARNGHIELPFFGFHGFASNAIAHAHDKPKYLLVPVVQDMGHGDKVTVYKKIFFATAEEAEAAKQKPYYGQ
jgi:hypothetical protein